MKHMDVFIVRPFGIKKAIKKISENTTEQVDLDFDKVNKELIGPALNQLNLQGGTASAIFEPGDIRVDMFTQLLLADIVIADITMHNANVFYELGIRHALRDKKTILIKGHGFDDPPFDIGGFRYVEYDQNNPGSSLPALVQTLHDISSTDRIDSPVFNLLPKLEVQGMEKFSAVPVSFTDEVREAFENNQVGKLSLLTSEIESCAWRLPGLRITGEAFYNLSSFDLSRTTWEEIKNTYPNEQQANERLATIYQRLAEREILLNPVEGTALCFLSDKAIDNLLNNTGLDKITRAKGYALKGRNAEARWIHSWRDVEKEQRCLRAFQSSQLGIAYKNYKEGYFENLNDFYAGINALWLLTIKISLAERYPEKWLLNVEKPKQAEWELLELKEKKQQLIVSIQLCIEAAKASLAKTDQDNTMLHIAEAAFACLTETRAARVGELYSAALEGAKVLDCQTANRQLWMYDQLDILPENTKAALASIADIHFPKGQSCHNLLFTGHMIDKDGRKKERFPQRNEAVVKQKIKEKLTNEIDAIKQLNPDIVLKGIASGACGGDILFHEICEEMDIQSEIYLALPRDQFIAESVTFAGPEWIDRFDRLYHKLPHYVLSQVKELPKWMNKENFSIWERANLWMLHSALVNGGSNMSLVALWDGQGGDGAGGTEHMVKEAVEKGAKTITIGI
ncbi:MAG: hypothetical protein ABIN01_05480 [Ferruginibacter sp.]